MGLLSFFKRGAAATVAPAAKPVVDMADAVQVLRVRARHRLIGAAVLVALGVIGFPLVFETQPRPIPVDLPIEIPRREAAGTLSIPAPLPAFPPVAALDPAEEIVKPAATPQVAAPILPAATPAPRPLATEPTLPVKAAVEKPKVVVLEKPAEKVIERPPVKPVERPVERVAERSAEKAPDKRVEKPASPEADRVQALLEGKPLDKKAVDASVRFILQVGAYADSKAAQDGDFLWLACQTETLGQRL